MPVTSIEATDPGRRGAGAFVRARLGLLLGVVALPLLGLTAAAAWNADEPLRTAAAGCAISALGLLATWRVGLNLIAPLRQLVASPLATSGSDVPDVDALTRALEDARRRQLTDAESLRDSEQRLELATSAAGIGIWDWNLLDNALTYSEIAKAICGFPPGEPVTYEMAYEVTHPDDRTYTLPAVEAALDPARREQSVLEYRLKVPDGTIRWVAVSGHAVFAEVEGTVRAVRYLGTMQDITARKRIEDDLRRSEGRLRLALSAGRMAVWEYDIAADDITGSPELHALLGFPEGATPSTEELRALYGPGQREQVHAAGWAAYERGERFFETEVQVTPADREQPRSLLMRAEIVIRAGDPPKVIGVVTDVTELRQATTALQRLNDSLERRVAAEISARETAQNRAAQAERMQALGQLAGGIAHDFNNVLQAVTGAASLVERRMGQPEQVVRFARLILEAATRGSAITRRLLAFARRGDLRAEPVSPAELLGGLREILLHTLGGGIAITLSVEVGLPSVLADRGQLETVLVNLATNARDAMPTGGRLTLAAERNAAADGAPAAPGLAPGEYVALSVHDIGSGMDAATMARATEPFFTTKRRGEGTGLGLAMARGFAEQSGGVLVLRSEPGRGTTVTLFLPAVTAAAAGAAAVPASVVPSPAEETRARVLLVDDDALVRESLADQLESAGFAVTAIESGAAALDHLRAGAPADALVTDLTMPGMDGLALIRAAQAARPKLPALLLTGYAGDSTELAAGGAIGGAFALLRKPVSGTQLADRILILLEAARGTA